MQSKKALTKEFSIILAIFLVFFILAVNFLFFFCYKENFSSISLSQEPGESNPLYLSNPEPVQTRHQYNLSIFNNFFRNSRSQSKPHCKQDSASQNLEISNLSNSSNPIQNLTQNTTQNQTTNQSSEDNQINQNFSRPIEIGVSVSICGNGICEQGENSSCLEDCSCYIGTSFNRDIVFFSSSSPWRTPISPNPVLDPDSSLLINTIIFSLQKSHNTQDIMLEPSFLWTPPIHFINSRNCDNASVYIRSDSNPLIDPDKDKVIQVPIPVEAWSEPTTDGHMIILDPFLMKDWEFSRIFKIQNSNNSWNATSAFSWDLTSEGYTKEIWRDSSNTSWKSSWWTYGTNGAGTPLIAGLITLDELKRGEINHALMASAPTIRNNLLTYSQFSQFCNPVAGKSDGQNIGKEYILEGARVQLDPAINIENLGLSKEAKLIAKTLQTYGLYITDGGMDFQIYFQNIGYEQKLINGRLTNYSFWNKEYPSLQEDLSKIPLTSFRVLKCENIITRI